jgi:hypothetical protein
MKMITEKYTKEKDIPTLPKSHHTTQDKHNEMFSSFLWQVPTKS